MADLITERTQEATPHRREQMRRSGPTIRSPELIAAVVGIVLVATLMFLGAKLATDLGSMMRNYLSADLWQTASSEQWTWHLGHLGGVIARLVLPMLASVALVVIAVQMSLGGIRWQPERLRPDANRLNPANYFEQLMSAGRWINVASNAAKTIIVAVLIGASLWFAHAKILGLAEIEGNAIGFALPTVVLELSLVVAIALLGFGLVDYAVRRWRHEIAMQMTPDEIREESKSQDGDPQIRGRRRNLHRSYAGKAEEV